jgi:hypothetical protein
MPRLTAVGASYWHIATQIPTLKRVGRLPSRERDEFLDGPFAEDG